MAKAAKIVLFAAVFVCCACQELNPPRPKRDLTVWRQIGVWSGHGSTQTDSFDMDVGEWRVIWKTSDESPTGKSTFKVTVNSAVSGRPLSVAVQHNGPGHGVAYVADDPRLYYLVVDSTNLDWTISVERPFQADNK